MKRAYIFLLKRTNWVLAGLLSLLGGNIACDDIIKGGAEYGTPHADFTIKGKVVNTDGTAIPGIEIKAGDNPNRMNYYSEEYPYKAITNAKGEYTLPLNIFGGLDVKVYAKDIDGETNGSFQPDSALIKGSDIKLKGGDKHWYGGKGEATVHFELKEEKKEDK